MLLVTGASGYLGSEILRRRHDAVGTYLTHPTRGFALDVRDAAAVTNAFERERPATVIHCAYRQDDRTTTLAGASAVARAAAAVGARLVHLSTDVVFDGEKGAPYTEDDEPSPITGYGRAKADAEREVMAAHPGPLIVRTSLLYGGPKAGPHERLVEDPDAVFFRDEIRSPIHVGDLASALLELAPLELSGVLHVAGADSIDRLELVQLLVAARGGDPSRLKGATAAASGLLRPRNCALSSARARSLLTTQLRGARAVLAARRPPARGLPRLPFS